MPDEEEKKTLISKAYKRQNAGLHRKCDEWGNARLEWVEHTHTFASSFSPESILDYGCGKGWLKKELAKLGYKDIREYDPGIGGKDTRPEPADFVVCNDVLEHVEMKYIHNVLDHLQSLIQVAGFFNIVLVADKMPSHIMPDGSQPHKIVQRAEWWLEQLEERWDVVVVRGRGKPAHELTVRVFKKTEGLPSRRELCVVCLLWGNWARGLGAEYANHLQRGVARNLDIPHRFICMTDDPSGISKDVEILPLRAPSYLGCLPKLCVYRPGNRLTGRVIVLDLDCIVTGSLNEMCGYDGEFCVREEFGLDNTIGGDMLGFEAGWGEELLWNPLRQRTEWLEKATKGDERVVYQLLLRGYGFEPDFWQRLYPNQFVSFKRHIKEKGLDGPLPDMRVVSFHGHPRCHEVGHLEWIQKHWR